MIQRRSREDICASSKVHLTNIYIEICIYRKKLCIDLKSINEDRQRTHVQNADPFGLIYFIDIVTRPSACDELVILGFNGFNGRCEETFASSASFLGLSLETEHNVCSG